MKHLQTSCPSCGGPVIFHASWAMVTVCEFCSTVIGRTDRDVEDLGKISEVGDPASGLSRGVEGNWKGKKFRIVGRVRYRHSAGGSWDEWYLQFPGERVGWLSEAQGRFALTTQHRLKHDAALPDFDSLEVGETTQLKDVPLTVREKGVASVESAEGEIPWRVRPGAEHIFVDLYGSGGAAATYEYGDGSEDAGQSAFLGTEVTLEDLGIDVTQLTPTAETTRVDVVHLNCPKCGGSLDMRAPDDTQRIACPNCTSMLDVREGKLSLFKALHQEKVKPLIPLGSEGQIDGVTFTVIGFMERYAKWGGQIFPWTEYLLYNRGGGFKWLVCNNHHWTLVSAVTEPPSAYGDEVVYRGRSYRIYDRGLAYVRYVIGEFYWRVTIGEKSATSDYISPPRILSIERSGFGKNQEANVSEGHYVSPEQVEAMFHVSGLPRPWGVGMVQPSPSPGGTFWLAWVGFIAYLAFAHLVIGRGSADGWLWFYAMIGISVIPGLVMLYRYSFEVQRWKDSDYSPYASDD